jgi:hypothetical protein
VDRIKRFDPSRQAATYWNRLKEAGLNRLILSTRFDPLAPTCFCRKRAVASDEKGKSPPSWSVVTRVSIDNCSGRFGRVDPPRADAMGLLRVQILPTFPRTISPAGALRHDPIGPAARNWSAPLAIRPVLNSTPSMPWTSHESASCRSSSGRCGYPRR